MTGDSRIEGGNKGLINKMITGDSMNQNHGWIQAIILFGGWGGAKNIQC